MGKGSIEINKKRFWSFVPTKTFCLTRTSPTKHYTIQTLDLISIRPTLHSSKVPVSVPRNNAVVSKGAKQLNLSPPFKVALSLPSFRLLLVKNLI